MTFPSEVAQTILAGFNRHYRLFRETSAKAKDRFERADWAGVRAASKERIDMYDRRVAEAVARIHERFPIADQHEPFWQDIKVAYIALLHEHRQPECAETFYNSVACRVLDRRYYRNEYIFRRAAVSTEHLDGEEPTYRCHYPAARGFRATMRDILTGFGLASPFEDLDRDVHHVVRALRARFPAGLRLYDNFHIQVLSSLFFRNKTAYAVGRALNGSEIHPFVLPMLRT